MKFSLRFLAFRSSNTTFVSRVFLFQQLFTSFRRLTIKHNHQRLNRFWFSLKKRSNPLAVGLAAGVVLIQCGTAPLGANQGHKLVVPIRIENTPTPTFLVL